MIKESFPNPQTGALQADSLLGELRREIQKVPCDRSDRRIMELLAQLRHIHHPEAAAVIEAIGTHFQNAEVRRAAKQVLVFRSSSLTRLWDETVEDQVSPVASRAARLSKLAEATLPSDQMVQSIFNDMKGEPIESAMDDRLPAFRFFLNAADLRVRLAAAFAICRVYQTGELSPALLRSLDIIADAAVNGGAAVDVLDTLHCLQTVGGLSAACNAAVLNAQNVANARFIRNNCSQ